MIPLISVITPTARWGGIEVWKSSLKRQTFKNFEAFLVDEYYDERSFEVEQFVGRDVRFYHIRSPKKLPGHYWNLNRSLNKGLSMASGRLVVFWQDYIYLPADALEKFWRRYTELGDCLIGGVGNHSSKPDHALNPEGKITIFTKSGYVRKEWCLDNPNLGSEEPEGISRCDPRIRGRGLVLVTPDEYETNWAACPLQIAQDIGGFDEDFDAGRGLDNVIFAERAHSRGYQVWIDESNVCIGLPHETLLHEEHEKQTAPRNIELYWKKHRELYNPIKT